MQLMKIDTDTLKLMAKFGGGMLIILLIVFLVAVATPYLARKIDSMKNRPARVKNDPYRFEKDNLKSIYEINADEKEDGENGRQ